MRLGRLFCDMPGWATRVSNLTGMALDFPLSIRRSDLLPFRKVELLHLEFLLPNGTCRK